MPTAFPAEAVAPQDNLLEVIYDCRPIPVAWPTFDQLRQRVAEQWEALPPVADVISRELREKRAAVAAQLGLA